MQQSNILTQANSNQSSKPPKIPEKPPAQQNISIQPNLSFSDLFAAQNNGTQDSMVGSCSMCQRYRQDRNQYQRRMVKMEQELSDKDKSISSLQQHITDLKEQEDYLMKAIEALRDRNQDYESEVGKKLDKLTKIKQEELNFANKQIGKLKQWLKQQKTEVYRSIENIKMKDLIIENLEKQLLQLKQQPKLRKKSKTSSSNKSSEQTELAAYKSRQKQLQNRIQQLIYEIDSLRKHNASMRIDLEHGKRSKLPMQEPDTPILKLKQFSKNSNNSEGVGSMGEGGQVEVVVNGRDNPCCVFLSRKCLELEREIQCIMNKMQRIKLANKWYYDYQYKGLPT